VTDVNDNDPVFQRELYSASLYEDVASGTSFLNIIAVDADEGSNGVVTYSLGSGADGSFVVDSITGVVSTTGYLFNYLSISSFCVIYFCSV